MIQLSGALIRKAYNRFERWRQYTNSRKQAHIYRRSAIERNGKSVIDSTLLREIKEYSGLRFGSRSYWPWLALYTEMRGEFIEGWIPEDYYRFELLPSWNPQHAANLSFSKSFDHRIFGEKTIQPIGLNISGLYFDKNMKNMDPEEFFRILKEYNDEVVIKMDKAASGFGILFLNSADITPGHFRNGSDYLIQPSVKQHSSLHAINPSSVNSLRITTFLGEDGTVSVVHRSLRIGVNGDRIVNTGGYFFYLNAGGEVISNAHDDIGMDRGARHPDTGFVYKDLVLDSMEEASELCRSAHLLYPYIRFIGWDLYIGEDEKPKLIEWNTRPDMWVNEALIGPLWSKDVINESRNEAEKSPNS